MSTRKSPSAKLGSLFGLKQKRSNESARNVNAGPIDVVDVRPASVRNKSSQWQHVDQLQRDLQSYEISSSKPLAWDQRSLLSVLDTDPFAKSHPGSPEPSAPFGSPQDMFVEKSRGRLYRGLSMATASSIDSEAPSQESVQSRLRTTIKATRLHHDSDSYDGLPYLAPEPVVQLHQPPVDRSHKVELPVVKPLRLRPRVEAAVPNQPLHRARSQSPSVVTSVYLSAPHDAPFDELMVPGTPFSIPSSLPSTPFLIESFPTTPHGTPIPLPDSPSPLPQLAPMLFALHGDDNQQHASQGNSPIAFRPLRLDAYEDEDDDLMFSAGRKSQPDADQLSSIEPGSSLGPPPAFPLPATPLSPQPASKKHPLDFGSLGRRPSEAKRRIHPLAALTGLLHSATGGSAESSPVDILDTREDRLRGNRVPTVSNPTVTMPLSSSPHDAILSGTTFVSPPTKSHSGSRSLRKQKSNQAISSVSSAEYATPPILSAPPIPKPRESTPWHTSPKRRFFGRSADRGTRNNTTEHAETEIPDKLPLVDATTLDERPRTMTSNNALGLGRDARLDYTPKHIVPPAELEKLGNSMRSEGGLASTAAVGFAALRARSASTSRVDQGTSKFQTRSLRSNSSAAPPPTPLSLSQLLVGTSSRLSTPGGEDPYTETHGSGSSSHLPSRRPSTASGALTSSTGFTSVKRDELSRHNSSGSPTGLPPPPRTRRPSLMQSSSSSQHSDITPTPSLSPKVVRRPSTASSLQSELSRIQNRKSIFKKPSFLDIDDDDDEPKLKSVKSSTPQVVAFKRGPSPDDDSFLDMGKVSLDTIRSEDEEVAVDYGIPITRTLYSTVHDRSFPTLVM